MARLGAAELPEAAAEVIARHQAAFPVKVGSIASDLGIKVLVSDLPLAVSGKLSKNAQTGEWEIRVNRHEHKNRQRFTIAHEIAHYLLHRSEIGNELVDDTFYRSGLSERRETEANKLAAEILMPWPLIRNLMQAGHTQSTDLADKLGVSEAAMHIRLGLPT